MSSDEENKKPKVLKGPVTIESINIVHEPVHPSQIITIVGPPPGSAGAAMQNINDSIQRQRRRMGK